MVLGRLYLQRCPCKLLSVLGRNGGCNRAAMVAMPSVVTSLSRQRVRRIFKPLATPSYSSSFSSPSTPPKKLVLFSKRGCCLCDSLKEKLLFFLSGPDSLHDVDLQVSQSRSVSIRNITSNPEWERAYQYEITVLAKVHSDGTEETLPRLSPRLGVELIRKKIATALRL